jgi:hypothetical protein
MYEDLVTIAVFHSQPEFLLARSRLESADIECFAYDENMLRIGGWHSHVLGGIKSQVRQSKRGMLWLSCSTSRRWTIRRQVF